MNILLRVPQLNRTVSIMHETSDSLEKIKPYIASEVSVLDDPTTQRQLSLPTDVITYKSNDSYVSEIELCSGYGKSVRFECW